MTTYYVAADAGSDDNDGLTELHPWKTLAKASTAALAAGDILRLLRGKTWAEMWAVGWSGSEGSTIQIRDYGVGAKPIITGGDARLVALNAASRTYLDYFNLDLRDATGSCFAADSGVHRLYDCDLTGSGDQDAQVVETSDVTFTRCLLAEAVDDGISIHNTAVARVRDCIIRDCGQGINGIAGTTLDLDGAIISGCTVDGILVDSDNVTINRAWVTVPASAGKGIQVDGVVTNSIIDMRLTATTRQALRNVDGALVVKNCTMLGNDSGDVISAATGGVTLTNCIFYDFYRVGYVFTGGAINADHCNFYSLRTKSLTSNTNEVSGDPAFANLAGGNIRLRKTSPCWKTGIAIDGLTTDYYGKLRPSTPSLGAAEPSTNTIRAGGGPGCKGIGLTI